MRQKLWIELLGNFNKSWKWHGVQDWRCNDIANSIKIKLLGFSSTLAEGLMCFFPLSFFSASGWAQSVNKDVFHNREAVKQRVVWSTENLILLLIWTSISTMSVIAFNTSIVIQSWKVLFIVWIYPLPVVGGREIVKGGISQLLHIFSLPQYNVYLLILFILAFFYFCLLCCVVLYQYLQADLHGKSSDTADKTSGKEGLRIKQQSGPLYFFIFSLLTPLESN